MKTTLKSCLIAGIAYPMFAYGAHATETHIHAQHSGMSIGNAHHSHGTTPSLTPLSVMGDHTHNKGDWMIAYRYGQMHMEGNRQGARSISNDTIVTTIANPAGTPATVRVVPLEMDMQMHMFSGMYGITDKLTLMAMAMYMASDMEHLTYSGMMGTTELGRFTTSSKGWGDTKISGIYKLYETDHAQLNLNAGISVPTGSIKEEDRVLASTGMTPTLRLPYAMQLGSGTWDGLFGATYSAHKADWSWGAQYNATLRLEDENSQGYRLGNKHSLTSWVGYQLTQEFGITAFSKIEAIGKIKGADANIAAPVQTANPDNYGGETIDLGASFSYQPSLQPLDGIEINAEVSAPIYQDLNGVQLERDWQFLIGISHSF